MTQKWNLQDIRPAAPREPKRGMPTTNLRTHISQPQPQSDMRVRTPRVATADTHSEDFATPHHHEDEIDLRTPQSDDRIPVIDGKKRTKRHLIVALVLFVIITGVGITVSQMTGGATVTITPKQKSLTMNATFTAYKEEKPDELTYVVMSIDAASERQVTASGKEDVKVQATGDIEISNNTNSPQRLIKNTRFATEDGKVFRIQESVVVPGTGKDSTGKVIPGTITAQVFADEAGDKYNLKAGTKLIVPGFKEGNYMDLYNAITATNKADFTNGFAGPKFKIKDEELATARQSLQAELRDSLLARIDKEKPADFTTFKSGVAITYTELPPVSYGDNLVTIKEKAVLQLPMFKAKDFAAYIAKQTIVSYEGDSVRIDNLGDLTFAYTATNTSSSNIADASSLNFKISGQPHIVWTFDEGKLKLDLAGVQKTAIPQILGSYPGIERSEVSIRPIWVHSMPKDTAKIQVIEKLSTDK